MQCAQRCHRSKNTQQRKTFPPFLLRISRCAPARNIGANNPGSYRFRKCDLQTILREHSKYVSEMSCQPQRPTTRPQKRPGMAEDARRRECRQVLIANDIHPHFRCTINVSTYRPISPSTRGLLFVVIV